MFDTTIVAFFPLCSSHTWTVDWPTVRLWMLVVLPLLRFGTFGLRTELLELSTEWPMTLRPTPESLANLAVVSMPFAAQSTRIRPIPGTVRIVWLVVSTAGLNDRLTVLPP